MKHPSPHTVRRLYRKRWASLLLSVYLLIALTPLAPFAMHSKHVAHAVTGECSGECEIDGCSLDSRLNHTCCCAQKKKHAEVSQQTAGLSKPLNVAAQKHCAPPHAAVAKDDWITAKSDCCAKAAKYQQGDDHLDAQEQEVNSTVETVYKCGRPCGKGKLLAVASTGTSEILPYVYSERIVVPYEIRTFPSLSLRMDSRHAEPPDPPPKLSISA